MKEIEDDTKKWKNIPCSCTKRTNIVKMSTLCKAICKFNTIAIKILTKFFTELEQTILKPQKTLNSQSNLEREKQSWTHHNSRLKLYYKTIVMKVIWCWYENRHIDQ